MTHDRESGTHAEPSPEGDIQAGFEAFLPGALLDLDYAQREDVPASYPLTILAKGILLYLNDQRSGS